MVLIKTRHKPDKPAREADSIKPKEEQGNKTNKLDWRENDSKREQTARPINNLEKSYTGM